jgi:hypothetical protein
MKRQWDTDRYNYDVIGKMTTDDDLINTNGIRIYDDSSVYIGYWNADGNPTKPFIEWDEDDFDVHE